MHGHADNLAGVGNQHDLVFIYYLKSPNHIAVTLTGLNGKNTLTATFLQPVISNRSPLAIAIFGNGQDGIIVLEHNSTHHLVVLGQIDTFNTGGQPPHDPDIRLMEMNGQSLFCDQENLVITGTDSRAKDFVIFLNGQTILTFTERPLVLGNTGLLNTALLGDRENGLALIGICKIGNR